MTWPRTGASHYNARLKLSKGCAIKRLFFLQLLGSRAFRPAKWTGPRLLSTVPGGFDKNINAGRPPQQNITLWPNPQLQLRQYCIEKKETPRLNSLF